MNTRICKPSENKEDWIWREVSDVDVLRECVPETIYDYLGSFLIAGGVTPAKTLNGEYYVYAVLWEAGIAYIGYGKKDRYKHPTSGASSSKILNKMYFSEIPMDVVVLCSGLSKSDSRELESKLINFHEPIANISGNTNSRI